MGKMPMLRSRVMAPPSIRKMQSASFRASFMLCVTCSVVTATSRQTRLSSSQVS
jgi:hypothetical protein